MSIADPYVLRAGNSTVGSGTLKFAFLATPVDGEGAEDDDDDDDGEEGGDGGEDAPNCPPRSSNARCG